MPLSNTTVTVGTTPTLLNLATADRPAHDVRWVEVTNASGVTVYLGGASVTSATGRPVVDGGSWSATLGKDDSLYAVVASGSHDVNVLKSRQ